MFLDHDNGRLHLELDRPCGAQGPLMLLFHGFTGHMEEPHILAVKDAALRAGCAVLRVELYGHGQSDGAFHDHTLFRWLTGAMAAADYAMSLPGVTELYLCGHSQGGLLVMLLASMLRDRIGGLIPLSPAWNIPEDTRRGTLLGHSFDPDHIPDELSLEPGRTLGGAYLRAAQTIYPEKVAPCYQGPVLLIHGTADETIPFVWGERAAALYRRCDFVPIEGDTHCYDHHLDQVAQAVHSWLSRHLASAGKGGNA